MTSLTFVFYLTCLFLWGKAQETHQSSSVHQESGFKSVNVGETVILRCFYENDEKPWLYWYKQTLGQKPKLISLSYITGKTAIFYDEFENNSRFTLTIGNGENHLNISDLRISDSATYYCASNSLEILEFAEGVTVSVKDSGLNVNTSVQSSSETVQLGDSVTLNCTVHTGTCGGEHRVYWFKDSEESHPGLIYTHGGRNDQCERKNNTKTRNCVYNLPTENQNLSHNGIYYCAVASCGHILFGNGRELELVESTDELDLVSVLIVAITFTTILVVFLVCEITNINSCLCTESPERFTDPSTKLAECGQDEDSICYSASRENNRRVEDDTWSKCVYFIVKQ